MHRKALSHLRRVDPQLAAVIDTVGPCRYEARADGTHFGALARAIVYQQLSGKAAGTIHARLRALYGDRDPTPAEILATPDETLRGVGLSRQKLSYLRDLATRAESGALPVDDLHQLDDDALTTALVEVKGIGRWTAQMFLMFRLGRTDVLPDLDLGIQKGIQRAYGMRTKPTPKEVLRVGEKWAPYRTIASWYLWRLLDTGEVERVGDAKRPAKSPGKRPVKRPVKRPAKRAAAKRPAAKRRTATKRRRT
ncbi:MAG TPA: DNA-3-methyladenine glycosylase [Gemmatimonadaceae bacterium]|nr:DNA-3-methyladenine glycosylase [Gemmatimonadaceae bacterium]